MSSLESVLYPARPGTVQGRWTVCNVDQFGKLQGLSSSIRHIDDLPLCLMTPYHQPAVRLVSPPATSSRHRDRIQFARCRKLAVQIYMRKWQSHTPCNQRA